MSTTSAGGDIPTARALYLAATRPTARIKTPMKLRETPMDVAPWSMVAPFTAAAQSIIPSRQLLPEQLPMWTVCPSPALLFFVAKEAMDASTFRTSFASWRCCLCNGCTSSRKASSSLVKRWLASAATASRLPTTAPCKGTSSGLEDGLGFAVDSSLSNRWSSRRQVTPVMTRTTRRNIPNRVPHQDAKIPFAIARIFSFLRLA
mmetsp:Transcript_16007/g.37745  ORF Transcript_16007/g.37745 Transcript_16007/m.37745 type:complete len:204 (-) Transcript_16007:248-859(-)